MQRTLVAVTLAVLISTAGCAAFGGGGDAGGGGGGEGAATDDVVVAGDTETNASGVNQTVRMSADESTAGDDWTSLSVTYPRDNFTVESAKHENVSFGVDTDADGDLETTFNGTHVSGVNTNDYSFTLELDTDYELEPGDEVVVEYPAVDNPEEPGNYSVEVVLNEDQTANGSIIVEE